jgi:hypothetical protein
MQAVSRVGGALPAVGARGSEREGGWEGVRERWVVVKEGWLLYIYIAYWSDCY